MMAIWKARRTMLIVGEGRDEEAFLNHLKQLYVPRGCGLSVTIKNARGKGALHVIDWTARQIANANYDVVAALLDTDTDWNAKTEKLARAKKIQVLKSEPCFEAMMLRLIGKSAVGDAHALTKQFALLVNNDATLSGHYVQHFGNDLLQAKKCNERTIEELLKLFGY
jgi:CO dehydrogenase/acetyl-CoA synthase epsilon subunit